jgi:hypothetical protein
MAALFFLNRVVHLCKLPALIRVCHTSAVTCLILQLGRMSVCLDTNSSGTVLHLVPVAASIVRESVGRSIGTLWTFLTHLCVCFGLLQVNVLDEVHNPGLREAIKSYSQWPTIPQVGHVLSCDDVWGQGQLQFAARSFTVQQRSKRLLCLSRTSVPYPSFSVKIMFSCPDATYRCLQ